MKRVLVLANNLEQASYRVRVEALLPALRKLGIETTVGLRTKSYFQNRRLYQTAVEFDSVLLQRKFLSTWEARVLRKYARRIVYDIDDALMFHNRPVGWFSRLRTKARFAATAAVVDHVVAGNAYLAEMFRKCGATTTVLPTVVDPARYAVKVHVQNNQTRLVWIGSRSTVGYLRGAMPALRLAGQRVQGLDVLAIVDEALTDSPVPVEHRPWSSETESASLVAGDIGIAPTPSDPWTLGKCGFKIVQYMAAGLPVVASPVGANAELVQEGMTGFLPKTDEAWADAIEVLSRDVALRQRMGQAGRARVEKELCVQRAAEVWAGLL